MAALVEAAVQGIELDNWAKMIPDLVFKADTLYNRIKKAAKTYPSAQSTAAPNYAGSLTNGVRPAFRVPMRIQSGAAIVQGTGDGDSLGRGTGSKWVSGDISPVFLFSGCEISYLTEIATSGPKRGMVAVRAQELKNSLTSFLNGIEALAQGDSSGTLDQIPTTAVITVGASSSIAGMNNANQFQDQQTVDFYPSEGGTLLGSAVISYVDGVSNTLYFSTDLTALNAAAVGATLAGYYVGVHYNAGVASSTSQPTSLAGIKTYQVNGNSGSVLGLTRSNYPGRLSTPVIDLGGKAVNPAVPYRAEILIKRGLGPETEAVKELVWYGGPDQRLAVTNLYQGILSQNNIYEGGKEAGDVVKKEMILTFGDREFVESYNATPGRIDGLCLGNWGIVEQVEPSLYSFGNGVTSMPVPDIASGASGSYLTSNIFFYHCSLNFFNTNMRAGVIIQNAAQPTI
jgi:hypothetical protein